MKKWITIPVFCLVFLTKTPLPTGHFHVRAGIAGIEIFQAEISRGYNHWRNGDIGQYFR